MGLNKTNRLFTSCYPWTEDYGGRPERFPVLQVFFDGIEQDQSSVTSAKV
jgi:hypothetical protein